MRDIIGRRQSLRGEAHQIIHGLARRWHLPWLEQHHNHLHVVAAFACLSGTISIALMAALAMLTGTPFVFPSLGSTAFLIFYSPRSVSASPRSTILGHLIGIATAYFALFVTGLLHSGSALTAPLTWPRALAVALALGLCAAIMILTRTPHPPAASTTLLIALGIVIDPRQVLIMYVGVALLVLQAIVINRLAGIPYPLWNAAHDAR